MIFLKKIYKNYQTGGKKLKILEEINLEVKRGDFISVIGRSGSGKTTLLNIIGMVDMPDEGEYFFEGKEITSLSISEISKIRGRNVGFIFQSFHLIDQLSVFENIEMPLGYAGMRSKQRKKRVMEVLDIVGLVDIKDSRPKHLSGGQQQKVAIARALAGDQSLLIADEPTGNLDVESRDEVMEVLNNLNKNGKTIILVTHDLDIASIASKTYKLENNSLHYVK